jgi:hypothetical protein
VADINKSFTDHIKNAMTPNFSMAQAFPTFKMFLMEEDNQDIFYGFDDFYTYNAVQSIEVQRFSDLPDQAIVVITNFSNLLSHRLHDATVTGKRDRKLVEKWDQPTLSINDNSQLSVPAGVQLSDVVRKNAGHGKETLNPLFNDLTPNFPGQKTAAPYQYYALQTGSKIQIRMGSTTTRTSCGRCSPAPSPRSKRAK